MTPPGVCRQHYRELSLPLSDLTINWYTTSELVRLCLQRRSDVGSEEGSEDGEGEEEQVVSGERGK